MTGVDESWVTDFSVAVARTLAGFRPRVADRVELLAVDCHPWHGVLDLSLLTGSEVERDPLLATASEMAAWKHYHFAGGLSSWEPVSALSRRMRDHYRESDGNHADVAKAYLLACSAALAAPDVRAAVAAFFLAEGFRISVQHPDTDEEFYLPARPC